MQQRFIHAMVLLWFSHFTAENERFDLKILIKLTHFSGFDMAIGGKEEHSLQCSTTENAIKAHTEERRAGVPNGISPSAWFHSLLQEVVATGGWFLWGASVFVLGRPIVDNMHRLPLNPHWVSFNMRWWERAAVVKLNFDWEYCCRLCQRWRRFQ